MGMSNYQNYKKSRERRQRFRPLILGGLAVVFVAVGIVLIFIWVSGGSFSISPTETPTITPTFTASPVPPTNTPTETATATITLPPTETLVPTPAEPFEYEVEIGDSCFSIADKFGIEMISILILNGLDSSCSIFPADKLIIPNPDMGVPTPTPLPPNLPRGYVIEYLVMPGDSLRLIAEKFRSTIEDIVDQNDFEDENEVIYPGQILKVRLYLVTPTFAPPTDTPEATPTP